MGDIPEDKRQFYTKEHLELIESRERLRAALEARNRLSQLEDIITIEALQEIAKRGIEILCTNDPKVYELDLEKMRAREDKVHQVYLLFDEEWYLQDLSPLLQFVSQEKRGNYEQLRAEYLGSD